MIKMNIWLRLPSQEYNQIVVQKWTIRRIGQSHQFCNGQLFEFCNASRDVSSIQNAFGGTFGDDVYAYVYVYGVEGEL